jgi:hypothetical protein
MNLPAYKAGLKGASRSNLGCDLFNFKPLSNIFETPLTDFLLSACRQAGEIFEGLFLMLGENLQIHTRKEFKKSRGTIVFGLFRARIGGFYGGSKQGHPHR